MSAAIGIVALALWLVFRADERLANLLSPRPPLGSLYRVGQPVMKVEIDRPANKNDAEMAVDLQNANSELLGFDCELRATFNGKDLDMPIVFSGYVNANSTTKLIVRIKDVPIDLTDKAAELTGRMRYNVTYYFANNKGRTRHTSKLVEWHGKFRPSGQGGETRLEIFVTFADEIEE